jgi:hypothetical protein
MIGEAVRAERRNLALARVITLGALVATYALGWAVATELRRLARGR